MINTVGLLIQYRKDVQKLRFIAVNHFKYIDIKLNKITISYCLAMHKEDVIEWNKPCQTDYLVLISPYSNNARLKVKIIHSLMGLNAIQDESLFLLIFFQSTVLQPWSSFRPYKESMRILNKNGMFS